MSGGCGSNTRLRPPNSEVNFTFLVDSDIEMSEPAAKTHMTFAKKAAAILEQAEKAAVGGLKNSECMGCWMLDAGCWMLDA